ncbi:MAG: serine hydrolase [Kiritimatiellae bacterium]|nr:serine hydrolase [Kiritimatiellia bacterium]
MIRSFSAMMACAAALTALEADGARFVRNIPYHPDDVMAKGSDAMRKKCMLDVMIPDGVTNWPVVVWYHGGGLVAGGRGGFCQISRKAENGIGGVSVGYRFLSEGTPTDTVGDAAAALAWTLKHISEYGGDPKKVFVSGSSGGGYLTAMVGMDPKWLAPYGYKPTDLAGLMPETGQMTKHFNVRKYTGDTDPQFLPKIDEWAPLAHAASNLPPICLLVGEPEIDWLGRAEENRLLYASLKALGHRDVEYHAFPGRRHGTMSKDAGPVELEFVRRHVQQIDGIWTPTSNKVLNVLEDYVSKGRVAGVVSVISDDRYVTKFDCAGWADIENKVPMRPDTVFAIFSMTKTFTGAAIMAAIDDGKMSLDDEVSKYLPEFADIKVEVKGEDGAMRLVPPKRPLVIRDLVTHTSGSRFQPPAIVKRDVPLREVARQMAKTPLKFQPGETFAYGNGWLDTAAAALEVAVGKPFDKWVFERITDPLGMRDTTFTPNAGQIARMVKAYTTDDKPLRKAADNCARQIVFPWKAKVQPCAAGGLFSTPQDMVRFSQMLAHHGEWKGRQIISRKTFDSIFSVKQTPAGVSQPYCVGSWLYGDWFGHEGAMRTDQRANLKTGHCRVFFIQTENRAGSAFFELKKAWNAACDEVQRSGPFNPGN